MTAPYLSPRFHPSSAAGPQASLDVRMGKDRPVRYPFAGDQFVVGGAESCDLRIIGRHLPAHICRLVLSGPGVVTFYRVDPAFPMLACGLPVGDGPTDLRHGDRLAIGPLDLTVHFPQVHLHPQLEPDSPPAPAARIDLGLVAERDRLLAECEELRAEAKRLADELPDVEATRDRHRAELAAERDSLAREADARNADLQSREAALAEREAEPSDWPARLESLRDQEAAFQNRLSEVATREAEVEATRTQLDERAAATEAEARELAGHSEALAAEKARLDTIAAELTARELRLGERAAELGTLESVLALKEAEFAQAHAAGPGEQARRDTIDAELTARELRLGERSAELGTLESALALKEAGFAEVAEVQAAAERVLAERLEACESRERSLESQGQKLREVGKAVAAIKRELAARRQTLTDDQQSAHARLHAEFDDLEARLKPLTEEVAAAKLALQSESDRLTAREAALETAITEHRLAVAGFREQMLAWQSELEAREAELARAPVADSPPVPAPADAEPLEELRAWYRKRLREVAERLPAGLRLPTDPLDPGDLQLTELLRGHRLAERDTVAALVAEAQRVRRPLRAVLLTAGAATLYQLAMMESGHLEALLLGRLRVIDRVRVTPREVVYRVSDPARRETPSRGVYLLRHLSEAEMDDAVRPDEFRQRFNMAREAAHLHLAQVAEVLEIHNRPAVLCEQPHGAPSGDWPPEAAHPGVWVRLLEGAAAGLAAAHRQGLAHGRLTAESFVLTPAGELKIFGLGEPAWLATGVAATAEPTPEQDLRALGAVSFGWALLAQPPGKRRTRGKAFPEPLLNVIRRLEAGPETPMADTATGAVPYESALELLAELARVSAHYPCPDLEWDRLVGHAASARPDGVRQSA